jgi:hypothetical protein
MNEIIGVLKRYDVLKKPLNRHLRNEFIEFITSILDDEIFNAHLRQRKTTADQIEQLEVDLSCLALFSGCPLAKCDAEIGLLRLSENTNKST